MMNAQRFTPGGLMLEFALSFVVVVVLLGLMAGLYQALFSLASGLAWLGVLLVAVWVGANIAGILTAQRLGQDSVTFELIHRVWSGLFFYTALLQAVVFTVAIFWIGALIFRDGVTAPATQAEFVGDFVRGSSAIAALLFLGVLLGGFADLGLLGKLAAGAYALAVIAVTVAPWLPAVRLGERVLAQPALVFWITLGAYALLSALGMSLYDAAQRAYAAKML